MDLYKLNTSPINLYMNSYLHYSKKKTFHLEDEVKDLHISLLEKRFLNTFNLDIIQKSFPYCKLKDLDNYYIQIISYYPINQKSMFYNDIPYMYHVGVDSNLNYPVSVDDVLHRMRLKMVEYKSYL